MSDIPEIAEDYRLALEDLNANGQHEISNLTAIARESTEHALAIADVLEKHILKTGPSKKLPALYVLDSIVKKVGTPYTLYFGRNLFKTFMEAYTVVDNNTRKRMEEMLKTWTVPVAGSMDTRPVFSPELVRPIENALMRAKALSMPQGQLPGRPRSAVPHRDSPTPPAAFVGQNHPYANGNRGREPAASQPPYHGQQQPPYYPPQSSGSNPALLPPSSSNAYGLAGASARPAGVNIETLSNDIQNLITAMQSEHSHNPHDSRFRALLDLQRIVQTTSLPQEQLELIKKQVTDLAAVTLRALPAQNRSLHSTPTPVPYQQTPTPVSVAHVPTPPAAAATPSQTQVSLDSLLGKGALAALMARQNSQQSTPTPTPFSQAPIKSPQPVKSELHRPASTQGNNNSASALLDQLRQRGLLPPATPSNPAPIAPPPSTMPALPANLASLLASSAASAGWPKPATPTHLGLDSASLKQYRRDTVTQLYDDLGPPCTQCGRRFRTDELGRRKKMAHMDWHFRVHQRSTEAEKRGTHRSWNVDRRDWMKSREVVDSDQVTSHDDESNKASKAAAEARPKYIPVPDASRGINTVCPICQDKFENKWLDTAQEWVWLDAVLVGNRAYHASCHAEATRDREATPKRSPEPVLGKRKAEVGLSSPKVRSLKTSA